MSQPDTSKLVAELLEQETGLSEWMKAAMQEISAATELHKFPEIEDANNTDYVYPH